MGAFGLLLLGLSCAELDRLALKMDPELDPEHTFVSGSDISHPGIEFSNPTGVYGVRKQAVSDNIACYAAFAMSVNMASKAPDLFEAAVIELRKRVPQAWSVQPSNRGVVQPGGGPQPLDGAIDLHAPNGTYATFAVEAKQSFAPRDVERVLGGLARVLRTLASNVPVLVVAPWLSPRTQELLETEGMNFIDLTGNALLRLESPALYIRSMGASRNPEPTPQGRARVRGPKAARVVRLLADVRPPYGVREIASATELTPGYVSRLLTALDRQALIERSRRGGVASVDVPSLLRWWAESYDVFQSNEATTFLAPAGAAAALAQLATVDQRGRIAVTGSFAAGRLAPVAAAALLLVYCDDVSLIANRLGLLPADDGGNVVLLRPFDPVVWERTTEDGDVTYAAPTQVVVDCLTGTGRMPAEGEALLAWMAQNESSWVYESLAELDASKRAA